MPIWYPESFAPKNWVEGVRRVCQTLKYSALRKSSILHAVLSLFFKTQSEHMHMNHFKDVKLLLYMFETRVQSFGTRFWNQVGHRGYYQGWWTLLTKHPIYVVFLQTLNAPCTFPATCIWGIKSFVCEKDACKVLRHNTLSKWAVGATAIYVAKASKITHPRC